MPLSCGGHNGLNRSGQIGGIRFRAEIQAVVTSDTPACQKSVTTEAGLFLAAFLRSEDGFLAAGQFGVWITQV